MLDIFVGAQILVDTLVSGVQETVTVTAVTSTTFTATFAHAHSATWTLTPQVQTTINAYGSVQGVLNDYSCQTFIRNFPQDHSVNKLTWAFRKTPDPTTTNPGQGGALFIQAVVQSGDTDGTGRRLSFTTTNQPSGGNLVVVMFTTVDSPVAPTGWTLTNISVPAQTPHVYLAYRIWDSTCNNNDYFILNSGSVGISYEFTGVNATSPISDASANWRSTASSGSFTILPPSITPTELSTLPVSGVGFQVNVAYPSATPPTISSGWTLNGYTNTNLHGSDTLTTLCAYAALTTDTTTPQQATFTFPGSVGYNGFNAIAFSFLVHSADPGGVTPGVTYPWVYWAETDVPGLPNPQSEQGVGFSYGQLSLGVKYDFGVAFVNTGGVAGPVGMFAQAYVSNSLLIPTQYLHDGVVFTPTVSPGIPSATIEPAPTIVQTATPSISGTNDAITLTFGSTPTLGNNMLAVITWDQIHAANLLTPAGWNLLEQVANNGSDPGYPAGMAIYYKVAGASEPTGPTFTLSNSDQTTAIGLSGYAQEWNGAGSFLHVTDSQTNDETSPAISTSTANAIPLHILSIVTTSTGLTYTPLAGWTLYGLASTSSLQIAQGPTTAAHLQRIQDIMTVTGLGSAHTSNGLVLVMPIVASDSVAPITIAPGANGTTSNIQVALQFTNQPLDGSLYAAAFWYRQTGSGTTTGFVPSGSTASGSVDGWSLYAAVEADGIYDPLGSLPLVGNYVFVFQDLSNGLTYDFGFSAINNRGGSSDIVVIPVSGQKIPYAPGGVVTNSTANLVPDSDFADSAYRQGVSGTGHGWGQSLIATTSPQWFLHGLDGDHTVIVKHNTQGTFSAGGGGIGGDHVSSGTLVWALSDAIAVVPGTHYSIGCFTYAQTGGGPMYIALVDVTGTASWTTIYKQTDIVNGTSGVVTSDLPWLCPPDGSVTKVAFLMSNGGASNSSYWFIGQPMMNPGDTTSVYVVGPSTGSTTPTPSVQTLAINSQGLANAASAPTITSGSGAPTAAQPVGSTYYNQSASTPVTTQYTNTTGGSGGWVASGPQSVETLTDATITSPTNGEVLSWDSTTSKWINSASTSGITSINGDTTAAQTIIGTGSISASTVGGVTTISDSGGGGGGGGLQIVQQYVDSANAPVNPSITFPVAATAGNFLLVILTYSVYSGTTFTPPSGWTLIVKAEQSSGGAAIAAYYKIAAGGETGFTGTSTPTTYVSAGLCFMEYSGTHTIDTTASYTSTSGQSTIGCPALTSPSSSAYIIGAINPSNTSNPGTYGYGAYGFDVVNIPHQYSALLAFFSRAAVSSNKTYPVATMANTNVNATTAAITFSIL
jgi:hypothetical protein